MDNFLVILDNENYDIKVSEFETTFDKPINLHHQFECALSEISFPTALDINYIEEDYTIKVKFDFWSGYHVLPKEQNKLNVYFFEKEFNFKFTNIDELESELNRVTTEMKNYIRDSIKNLFNLNFQYYKKNRWLFYPKIYIDENILKVSGGGVAIEFESDVYDTYAKSFVDNNIQLENPNITWPPPIQTATWSTHPFNVTVPEKLFKVLIINKTFSFPSCELLIRAKIDSYPFIFQPKQDVDIIFVYCNIVKHSFVGNTRSNILRVFKRLDKTNHYNFQNLLYVPLRIEEINSIKISCRNNLGEIIKYTDGHISLTLLFRPIENI